MTEIEFITTVVLTFALGLVGLGLVTIWLERDKQRWHGAALVAVGLLVGAGYAFLASRYSLQLLGRLVVAVDLPALVRTAMAAIVGVAVGAGLAAGVFLWATGRFRQRMGRAMAAVVVSAVLLTLIATIVAIALSKG
jgi:uncharacterized membrane protein YkvI